MITLLFIEVKNISKVQSLKLKGNETCSPGFRLDKNLNHCIDINECEELKFKICHKKVCRNTLGGYQCLNSQCPDGYRVHPTSKYTHINKCVRKRCKYKNDVKCQKVLPKYKIFKSFHVSHQMSGLKNNENGQFLELHHIFMKRFDKFGVDIKIKTDECVAGDSFEISSKIKTVTVKLKNPIEVLSLCNRDIFTTVRVINKKNQHEYERIEIYFKYLES
ncbi:hypothetical protein PVAND_015713 [Polypedilum vanderplanki]|uniref:EGF-like calcium-binding domain-containing protein n=1 Tax=Polypedilum vanderplanki TaxID=319348 RepID=A0A9J6BDP1_POLVA|nr:hypothetical protein PVAND_015713 [Polypedilum vanderplanki]